MILEWLPEATPQSVTVTPPPPFSNRIATAPSGTQQVRVTIQHHVNGQWVSSAMELLTTNPTDCPQKVKGSDTSGNPGHSEVQIW